MKIMKKFFTLSLAFCLVLSTFITANAQVINKDNTTIADVEKMLKEYGYETVNITDKKNSIKVDSLEELEKYLQSVDKVSNNEVKKTIKVKNNNEKNTFGISAARGNSTYSDNYLWNWYNPFAGFDGLTLVCWSNVYMGYSYEFVNNEPRFVSVDSVKSYLTGIKLTTWDQNGYSSRYKKKNSYKDTVKLKVDGCYILGFEFKGFTIGAKRNKTWKTELTLTK